MPPEAQPPTPDYATLVALIRTELDLAIKPLREDIHELKGTSYTREMIDSMFALRDERIHRLANVFGTVAGVAGTLWAVLAALQILHVIP